MDFMTHSEPLFDLGGTSNVPRPSLFRRRLNAALVCSVKGHDFQATGYANAHKFSWLDWRIGRYQQCRCCFIRHFENLKTQSEFDTVLAIELARWMDWKKERDSNLAAEDTGDCPA